MINVSSFSECLQAGFQFAVDDGGFRLRLHPPYWALFGWFLSRLAIRLNDPICLGHNPFATIMGHPGSLGKVPFAERLPRTHETSPKTNPS